jgi:hypothetical protein
MHVYNTYSVCFRLYYIYDSALWITIGLDQNLIFLLPILKALNIYWCKTVDNSIFISYLKEFKKC